MKLMAGLAAAAALTLAPMAHAQVSCEDIEMLAELAWEDFFEISGDEVDDFTYETDYWLEDADECYVSIDMAAMYACQWVFAGEADATAAYEGFARSFESCLPGWGKEPEYGGEANGEMTPIRTVFVIGPGDLADLEWAVALDRHEATDVLDFHVSVALAYW